MLMIHNIMFHFTAIGKPQAIISEEEDVCNDSKNECLTGRQLSKKYSREMAIQRLSSQASSKNLSRNSSSLDRDAAIGVAPKRGMVLPFFPLAMSFNNVNYYVDMPGVSIFKCQISI